MSDEMQQLIKQKQLIEEKIRNMLDRFWRSGCVRLIKDPFASNRPDVYCLQIESEIYSSKKTRWRAIKRAPDVKSLVETIPAIIKDLQAVYEMLQKEDS